MRALVLLELKVLEWLSEMEIVNSETPFSVSFNVSPFITPTAILFKAKELLTFVHSDVKFHY